MTPAVLMLTAAGFASVLAGHISEGDPRNAAVMPQQRIQLPFDHELHLSEAVGPDR